MMLTRKEPFDAERLLLSTGIVNYYMDSNWEDGRYSAVGRRIETPYMNMTYHSTHGPLFETGPRPPNTPYIRGSHPRLCPAGAADDAIVIEYRVLPPQVLISAL